MEQRNGRPVANRTYFTFTTDPRGGFWYVDTDEYPWGPPYVGDKSLVRFSEEDGSIIEQIDVQELIGSELPVYPFTCLLICGTCNQDKEDISVHILAKNEQKQDKY